MNAAIACFFFFAQESGGELPPTPGTLDIERFTLVIRQRYESRAVVSQRVRHTLEITPRLSATKEI